MSLGEVYQKVAHCLNDQVLHSAHTSVDPELLTQKLDWNK